MSSTPWFAKQQSDQCGAILDRPALGLGATETLFVVQALWVETRETSQQFGVKPVGFGVRVGVVPQISRLLRRHHHHLRSVAPESDRQGHPGIAGGFPDDGDGGFSESTPLPESLQILRAGAKADVFPEQRASGVGAGSAMDGRAGDSNADPDGHEHLLVLGGCVVVVTAAGSTKNHSR
jgi:hypothetical protein